MTREEFIDTIEGVYRAGVEIIKRKNASYGGATDPFKNFFVVESLEVATAEQAILVRLSDKMSRLATLIARKQRNTVEDETVYDTLIDAINYLAILYTLLKKREHDLQLRDVRTDGATSSRLGDSFRAAASRGAGADSGPDYRPTGPRDPYGDEESRDT